ncbi:MAG: RidA family protein [Chloroflexi bacterium]|nr:RidA family protein [Chloroflexota bacterium]
MKEFRNPQDVHQPLGGYSHQIEIRGNERMLILSGQVGMTEDGSIPDDPIEQIDLAMENIFRNLRAANMEVTDLIKLTYYLVGEIDTVRRRELVASKLQGHKPCSTLVYVARLATPAIKVEIDAWASRAE